MSTPTKTTPRRPVVERAIPAPAIDPLAPAFRYFASDDLLAGLVAQGPTRTVTRAGRTGLIATSIHTSLRLDRHTVAADRGSLSLWVMPLEDLHPASHMIHFDKHEPDYRVHSLLSDIPARRDLQNVNFSLHYAIDWWRQINAQFIGYASTLPGVRAVISPDFFKFRALKWHQISVTWDRPAHQFRLYVNGIRIDAETPFLPMTAAPCNPSLFAGNPNFAMSELCFFDRFLDDDAVAALYDRQVVLRDRALDAELSAMHVGASLPPLRWSPDADWREQLALPLTRASDLDHFYVQGCTTAHTITPEGLLVDTPQEPPGFKGAWGENKVENYFWTHRTFEGDIALSFDFMPQKPNGLALAMVHASGMQREDFMADHPLRTNGSMSMVCWENVRNYHWEFFREIDNCRNDCVSHLLVKNPWMAGLAYQCQPGRIALNQWHTLQLIQEGPRLRGAIDGIQIFDATDDPYHHNGPLLNFGRVALRCKYKTKMLFRNLRILTRPIFEERA
jgi:hypothetical protein